MAKTFGYNSENQEIKSKRVSYKSLQSTLQLFKDLKILAFCFVKLFGQFADINGVLLYYDP